ncbi:hypothetical protein VSVS05_04402 (plasmid) [Vibrio scophthalmi]|uniref:Uncharacterized protein n=1 Tax=Vibrio scophthalmi TaxID=45658 RepID=A0A1C7FIC4_9VIBR|nr:hypothetical protein VSVS05_04402 [Vibrio scophthalmi]
MNLVDQLLSQIEAIPDDSLRRSKLDPYQNEILFLRQHHLSYRAIAIWLNVHKSINISTSQLAHCIKYRWKKTQNGL